MDCRRTTAGTGRGGAGCTGLLFHRCPGDGGRQTSTRPASGSCTARWRRRGIQRLSDRIGRAGCGGGNDRSFDALRTSLTPATASSPRPWPPDPGRTAGRATTCGGQAWRYGPPARPFDLAQRIDEHGAGRAGEAGLARRQAGGSSAAVLEQRARRRPISLHRAIAFGVIVRRSSPQRLVTAATGTRCCVTWSSQGGGSVPAPTVAVGNLRNSEP